MTFTTYDQKPVSACYDLYNTFFSKEQQLEAKCTGNESKIEVGTFYNDVWAYNLKCNRYFDGPCEGSGWMIWHPGSLEGGCTIELGIEVSSVSFPFCFVLLSCMTLISDLFLSAICLLSKGVYGALREI